MLEKGIPRKGYKIFNKLNIEIGVVTSGTMSPSLGKSIGMGYVEPDLANIGQKLTVNILGERYDCEIVEDSPYDSKNITIRVDA